MTSPVSFSLSFFSEKISLVAANPFFPSHFLTLNLDFFPFWHEITS
jgi:hypothetical protein